MQAFSYKTKTSHFIIFVCSQKSIPENIREAAKIFHKEPLTDYHRSLNDEAAKLAKNDPTLLANRGELLQRARDSLLSSGSYQFKKGKSHSKQVDGNSVAGSSGSKREKVDKEARGARMKEVEENIQS